MTTSLEHGAGRDRESSRMPESLAGVAKHGPAPERSRRPTRMGVRGAAGVLMAMVIVSALFLVGYLPKRNAREALAREAQLASSEREVPKVLVVKAKRGSPAATFTVPGTLKGQEQALLLARASGYLSRYLVDLGDTVESGQLLAEVDTPELDREVEQARANLGQSRALLAEAKANGEYARVSLERYRAMVPAGVASQVDLQKSEAESRVADAKVGVAEAALASQTANVSRLQQLKAFARVTAPFAGVITARRVDRGSLVTAGSSALFELAVVEPLSVVIDVPQSVALTVKRGGAGKVKVRELRGETFSAKVARSSGALDPVSRTLHVELEVPNPKRALLPGMYAEVEIELDPERQRPTFSLPASAVIGTRDGLRVAVVGNGGTVKLKPVVIERDTGTEVEIRSGVDAADEVIAAPGPFLADGDKVKAAPLPASPTPRAARP